jgi:hypothetical protein
VQGLGCCAALAASGSGLALAASSPAPGPSVRLDRHCYPVGSEVALHGAGFAPSRAYVVSLDGVYFGQDQTDATGAFATSLSPGGLSAGDAQVVDQLEATDGSSTATASFTVTRAPGARFLAPTAGRTPTKLPLEVWDFSPRGARRSVYIHYLTPAGAPDRTVTAGHTTGQCGYLRTRPRPIFPFTPSSGTWTLQLDTHRSYARRRAAPVARIRVRIG